MATKKPSSSAPARRASKSPGGATPDTRTSRAELIAQRAYELYQARGGSPGDDLEDWLKAEQQVDADRPAKRRRA